MNIRLLPIVILLAPALTGCFRSTAPLISPESAVYPFSVMSYEAYPSERFVYVAGELDNSDTLIRRDSVYRLTAQADSAAEILLLHAGDNIYLVQLMPGGSADPYLYFAAMLDRPAMRIILYRAEALPGDFRAGARECEPGVACLTDLAALEAIVREAIEAGDRPMAILDIFDIR